MRPLTLLLVIVALATPARAERCKGVVLPVQGGEVPASLVALADEAVRRTATAQGGCELVPATAVADMVSMLSLPPAPGPDGLARLARSLLARWAVQVALVKQDARIQVSVVAVSPAGERVAQRSSIPAAGMLAAVERLTAEAVAGLRAAPSSQPASQPASQPVSQPTVAARPASQPAARRQRTPTPRQRATAPAKPARRATRPTVRRREIRMWAGAGVRGYYLRSWDRGGPLVELELGGLGRYYRGGLLLRTYFGDRTGYYVGGRGEVGPRWGAFRLSFGGDLGLLFIPDTADSLDMMILNLHPVGAVLELGPVVLHLDAFSLDLYLVPANPDLGRDPDLLYGFSAGLTVGVGL